MELHLKIIGLILVILALIHSIFPKYFNWAADLKSVSLITRQILYIHTFFIALMLLLMGLLCITFSQDITTTRLGHGLSLGMGVFWIIRLLFQFFGYSKELWKGKRFESFVHVIFVFIWTYFSVVFLWTGFAN